VLVLFLLLLVLCSGCYGNSASVGGNSAEEMTRLRKEMIDQQIIARGVRDPLVLEALARVERHRFVPAGYEQSAYGDSPLPIGEGQTISQPYIVALMTELGRITPESKVLEIGTGSGYQAAILAEIAREVYSIEIVEKLGLAAKQKLEELGYTNVHVRIGDGYKGWPEAAPFDAVLVTAAPDHVPQPLLDQLKVGGRLIIPVGSYYQQLQVILRTEDGFKKESIVPVRFVPMTGEAQKN
jgi:protein-L-isoaspartate(D-aspartate) O-methyltransferase